jgi:magnesium chelatase subunit D
MPKRVLKKSQPSNTKEVMSRSNRSAPYPFSAIVGQDEMKLALILSVVDPKIGGVLIMGHRGTGKSTAVRALADLLPEIRVVEGCEYGCDPEDERAFCDDCAGKTRGQARRLRSQQEGSSFGLAITTRSVPVVDLPLGATEDRVCGTIDIERALNKGEKRFEPGLLARANRGFLYIDEVNLLDDHLVDILLDVSASGWNKVERESVSVEHPARFVLIGSGNPEEGELRPQLLDRFGLHAEVTTENYLGNRVSIVERRDAFDRNPAAFREEFAKDQNELRKRITYAQQDLPRVKVDEELLRRIAQFCAELKVDGHRGELTIMRASRALAAFEGRKLVDDDDVRRVANMSLRHRLRKDILEETATTERIEQVVESVMNQPPPSAPDKKEPKGNRSKQSKENQNGAQPGGARTSEPSAGRGLGRSNSEEAPSPPAADSQTAAPQWDDEFRKQKRSRKPESQRSSRGLKAVSGQPRGRYTASVLFKPPGARVALDATLRALATSKSTADAIRYKVLKQKQGTLYIFAIDTSGSMAANRIARAKASILKLLRRSYLNRDHVAVVSFHGTTANVALPPSRSIIRARRVLDSLQMGGATPLSAGLTCTIELIRRHRDTHSDTMVLLFTDGHANVPMKRTGTTERASRKLAIESEVKRLSAALQQTRSRVVVVDVQREFESSEESRRLAEILKGRFVKLGVEPPSVNVK